MTRLPARPGSEWADDRNGSDARLQRASPSSSLGRSTASHSGFVLMVGRDALNVEVEVRVLDPEQAVSVVSLNGAIIAPHRHGLHALID